MLILKQTPQQTLCVKTDCCSVGKGLGEQHNICSVAMFFCIKMVHSHIDFLIDFTCWFLLIFVLILMCAKHTFFYWKKKDEINKFYWKKQGINKVWNILIRINTRCSGIYEHIRTSPGITFLPNQHLFGLLQRPSPKTPGAQGCNSSKQPLQQRRVRRKFERLQEHRGFLRDVYFSFCELDGPKSSVPLSASWWCQQTYFGWRIWGPE